MCSVASSATVPANSMQGSGVGVQFVTTYGFTTTHGFSLPSGGGAQPLAVQQQQQQQHDDKKQQQQQQQQQMDEQGVRCGLPAKEADSVRSCSTLSTNSTVAAVGALAVRVPSMDNTLGWRGMLEASRATVGSGVLGCVSASEAGPRCAKMDLVCTAHATPGVRRLIKSVVRGLKACQDPERAKDGMGGTYFCLNESSRKVAIFKPCDEEPLAPNNPKGYVGRNLGDPGWKLTVRVGEAALREVAAYLLDHGHFARVPHTTLVRASHPVFHYAQQQHLIDQLPASGAVGEGGDGVSDAAPIPGLPPKLGSLQEFVSHLSDTSELGSGRLAKRDVHHIGILDIRLFNTDRHAGNILVCNPTGGSDTGSEPRSRVFGGMAPGGVAPPFELVPIDHGFCLPEALEPPYFEWLHWPQAMLPFEQPELDYIAALDVAADVELLRSELPALRPQCLRVLQVGTVFLQRCAASGLTLAAMGSLMSRPLDALDGDDSHPSELEKACVTARQAVETAALLGTLPPGSSLDSSMAGLTLAEADEEGEEEEEDFDGDDGRGIAPKEQAGVGVGQQRGGDCAGSAQHGDAAAVSVQSGCLAGHKKEDGLGLGLLFDLEAEGDSSMASGDQARCNSCDLAAPQSPFSQVSIDSLGSGAGGSGHGGVAVGHTPSAGARTCNGGGSTLAMARSVHAGNGFLWRATKPAGIRTQSPRRSLAARVAYPPPVVAVPPRSTSEVLSGLGDEQWAAFMQHLAAIIDEQLSSGAWTQAAAAPMAVAMSCPRF